MDLNTEYEFTIKLLIVGDSTVGKTNFIHRFIENNFNENYFASTGMDLKTTSININDKIIKLQIWDTAGQEKYKSITKTLFLKAQGILALYDITSESSFINLKNWLSLIEEECNPDVPRIIVGNKIDLIDKRVIEKEKALEYATQKKIDYIETSSKTGENIHKSILLITKKVLQKLDHNRNFSFSLDSSSSKKKINHGCC